LPTGDSASKCTVENVDYPVTLEKWQHNYGESVELVWITAGDARHNEESYTARPRGEGRRDWQHSYDESAELVRKKVDYARHNEESYTASTGDKEEETNCFKVPAFMRDTKAIFWTAMADESNYYNLNV
ncbi:hypothetical protein HAX54_000885, partial [Datura stramonium]|nr:hypothetical protein [Datura stramonium]